jgi:putative Mg2+ transporter-C (MgtC) family protein
MLFGGAIGLEREISDKPAGLRTHMIVAGAAALFVSLGDALIARFSAELGDQLLRSDPIRIVQAVITGISFLGAGTIIRRRSSDQIEGLTTAASILAAAGVGVCTALSQIILAVGMTLLVLIVVGGVGRLERWLGRRRR